MPPILPLRTGWDPIPGGPNEYPADLPPDWRLAYFANAYWGVLVPTALWRQGGVTQARIWVAETPARFRLYLDLGQAIDPGPAEIAESLAPVCAALGGRLGGLVGHRSALQALSHLGLGGDRLLRIPAVDARPRVLGGLGCAWEVPAPLRRDLRGARAWIAERAWPRLAQGTDPARQRGTPERSAVLLGECPFEDLARWQTLLELMGLA